VDDSPICSVKVEGTPLQSDAITDAQSDAALDTRSCGRLTEIIFWVRQSGADQPRGRFLTL